MILKSLAQRLLPSSTFALLASVRSRRLQKAQLESRGLLRASRTFLELNGASVRNGPFAGMVYPSRSAQARHIIPKLLGTYEQELHPVIRLASTRRYDLVIDIGSAEGYYAVGLARLLGTKVLAFDPEPIERRFCTEMAKLNGVSNRVQLRSLFSPLEIENLREKRAFCICDCEGCEEALFTRETVRNTGKWDLIIELHGTAEENLLKLSWPQTTTVIESAPRTGIFPELDEIGDPQSLLSEYRNNEQRWLWCDSGA